MKKGRNFCEIGGHTVTSIYKAIGGPNKGLRFAGEWHPGGETLHFDREVEGKKENLRIAVWYRNPDEAGVGSSKDLVEQIDQILDKPLEWVVIRCPHCRDTGWIDEKEYGNQSVTVRCTCNGGKVHEEY